MNPRQSPFLADPALLDALQERATPFPCPEHRVLFWQGEESFGLFILHSGQARMEMHSNTGELMAQFLTGDGSLLGLPAVVSCTKYSITATALQGSIVSLVERAHVLDLIASDPVLRLKALQAMAAQIQAASAVFAEEFSRRWEPARNPGDGSAEGN